MKTKVFGAIAAALLVLSATASGSVVYQFSFTGLSGVSGGTGADFGITLTYPTYVTTTGMVLAPGGPFSASTASLGYPVAYAGTNNIGFWGFDDNTGSNLTDGGFGFDAASFLFIPSVPNAGYFTTPGTFGGSVVGNAPSSFSGSAVLTIRESGGSVPEPMPLALVALGLVALAATRLRQS